MLKKKKKKHTHTHTQTNSSPSIGKLLLLNWYNTQNGGYNQTGVEKLGCDII
jgi:hypothetical protein